jgi:HlyD family type I secretion membrane fusion protein
MSFIEINQTDWTETVPDKMWRPTLFGLAILLAALASMGVWAVSAPLSSAVIAPGKFVAVGQNKIVQHLEGGIIKSVAVYEGARVKQGDKLLTLDDTGPRANLQLVSHRLNRLRAQQARLIAESRWASDIVFPDRMMTDAYKNRDEDTRQILERQQEEFQARRDKTNAELSVLRQEIVTRRDSITGHEAEIASLRRQLVLIDEELKGKEQLYQKKLVVLPKLLELRRVKAQLDGRIGVLRSSIAEQRNGIVRTERQILQLRTTMVDRSVADLRKVEGEIDDLREQLRKAEDVLRRLDVRAPVDGIIMKLAHNVAGGVVKPGGPILEIVPIGDEPIVEARIKPSDIDQIAAGDPVRIRLTALNQRLTPIVSGQVTYVSADTLDGSGTRADGSGYLVRIMLDREQVSGLDGFRPVPGMPVEAFISTGERTFFDYLMRPVLDSMARAFREA